MRILDRYILKSVLAVFFSCIFAFLFLYVIIDTLSHLQNVLKNHVPIYVLISYYLYYLPIMFSQVAPFACLLSTLYSFGKLNQANELIAMRSSGLSILQVSKTVIIFGLLVSLFVFWNNDNLVPKSLASAQKIMKQIDEGTKNTGEIKQEVIANLSMYGSKNRLFFISKFFPLTDTMEGITILEHDEHQNLTKKIVAYKGAYQDGVWRFYNSTTFSFDRNGQIVEEPKYLEEEIMDIDEKPRDFLSQGQRPDSMSIRQLGDYIGKLSRSGASTVIRNLKVDLYQRFTSPFTSLIIILLGIPFSLMIRKRAAGLSSIGISIMVGFLYYIVEAVSIALGKSGYLVPVLAASLSHIIALLFSVYLIAKLP